jgi:hypothetical protein
MRYHSSFHSHSEIHNTVMHVISYIYLHMRSSSRYKLFPISYTLILSWYWLERWSYNILACTLPHIVLELIIINIDPREEQSSPARSEHSLRILTLFLAKLGFKLKILVKLKETRVISSNRCFCVKSKRV